MIYATATSACDVRSLGYMERLGLWGAGSSFADFATFNKVLSKMTVAALEAVARDLKSRQGCFVARSLSYAQTECCLLECAAARRSGSGVRRRDGAVGPAVRRVRGGGRARRMSRRRAMSLFWGSHQAFVSADDDRLEAARGRRAREGGARGGPRRHHRPAEHGRGGAHARARELGAGARGRRRQRGRGSRAWRRSRRSIVKLVLAKLPPGGAGEAAAAGLADAFDRLALPPAVLDHLIDELGGTDAVAEMTEPQVPRRRGGSTAAAWRTPFVVERRNAAGGSMDAVNITERNDFQAGRKRVAVISEAASTARACARRVPLQVGLGEARRPHARAAVARRRGHPAVRTLASQQSQVSGPSYVLAMSALGGERRFASCIAKRVAQLAFTRRRPARGRRQRGGRASTTTRQDLDSSRFASAAVKDVYEWLATDDDDDEEAADDEVDGARARALRPPSARVVCAARRLDATRRV